MKPIGPTFAAELTAAGLLGLPFSWGADGALQFDAKMLPAQIAAVTAVYAAHDPTAKVIAPSDPKALAKSAVAADPTVSASVKALVALL